MEWKPVVLADECPSLRGKMLLERILLNIVDAIADLIGGVDEHLVRTRGDHRVIRTDFVGKAKAQAAADAFREVVPHRQRIVLVGADDQVNVIPADRAGVADATVRADHVADCLCDFFALRIVNPEDREVEQLLVLRVELAQFSARRLLAAGFAPEMNRAQRFKLVIVEVA